MNVTVFLQESQEGVPVVVQWKQIRLGTMRLRVQSLALLSGLRIPALPQAVVWVSDVAQIWHWCGCVEGWQLRL